MKKVTFLILFVSVLIFSKNGWSQTTIDSQGFETDLSGYSHTPSQIPADDPGDQYFYRAEPSDPAIYEGNVGPYTNVTGNWLFVGSNPNTINGGNPGILTLDPITVTGYSSLEFHADFGACDNDWDLADDLKVEYNFDGGSWVTLFYFNAPITNDPLVLTGNAVGGINTANGTVLTYALTTISSDNFIGSGSTLNIRIVQDVDANYEAFGVDNIQIKGLVAGGVSNPTDFTAVTAGIDQIDLSWTQNGNSDDVMVAWSSDGIFGTPSGTYVAGDAITDGGTVIYNGSATSTSHTSLTADTRYYYSAWSVDATPDYSSGVTDDTTTLAAEPTADPTTFIATTNSTTEITVDWTDAAGATAYLIKGSGVGYASITDPVDGITEADGSLVQNVASAVQTHQFIGLAPNTTYYFQIYPYNGDNGSVNYKIDNPQQATETTDAANLDLIISEVADPGDHWDGRFVEIYNLSVSTIDFSLEDWFLVKQTGQTGGGGSTSEIQLTGSIDAGNKYTIANNSVNFNTYFGFIPDLVSSTVINGNGDDAYYLYYGGGYGVGTLVDVYGEDEDGSGLPWDYLDSKAVRLRSVTGPNTTWTASEWDIPSSADVADMTPSEYGENVTWAGAGTVTDDWNEKGGNWSGTWGYIPDASFDVTIPTTAVSPVISGESACNALTIQSDAALDIAVSGSLTAYDLTDVAASKSRAAANFTIKSDATGNGSFIPKWMVFGDVTTERYIAAYTGNDGWHQISSPVDFMPIAGSDFEPGLNDDLFEWMEQTAMWHNYKPLPGTFTDFVGGRGYLVAYETTATKQFVGQLTNNDFGFTNLTYTPAFGNGWNFLGNPYTSAIAWDANSADWALNNIGGVAEIWDESAGNYALINNGDVIPSTNGFFVQATDASNSMIIPASARVHNTTNNYKSSRVEEMDETLILTITNDENTYFDVNRIGFRNDATEEWDIAFDAHKMYGSATAPQLWTVSNDEIFSQNYLPYVYESYQLPLNFRAGVNSTYHLNFEGVESFYPNSEIHLEDVLLDKIIDIREQQLYDFTASTTDDENRFILHFYGVTTTGDNAELSSTRIFSSQNTIYIQSGQMPKDAYRIEVFNVMGQMVYAEQMEPSTLGSFILNNKTGVYVVRVYSDKQTIVQKVMIK